MIEATPWRLTRGIRGGSRSACGQGPPKRWRASSNARPPRRFGLVHQLSPRRWLLHSRPIALRARRGVSTFGVSSTPTGGVVAATPSTWLRFYDCVCSMMLLKFVDQGLCRARRRRGVALGTASARWRGGCPYGVAIWCLQFVSCFDELEDRRAPRSRPGHRPEVGPPVRLIFRDVAGLRNGGARTPLHHLGDGATARGRRSPGAVATAKGASPRSLIDGACQAGRVEVASDLSAAATCFPSSRF